jgi:hypothetical protein
LVGNTTKYAQLAQPQRDEEACFIRLWTTGTEMAEMAELPTHLRKHVMTD